MTLAAVIFLVTPGNNLAAVSVLLLEDLPTNMGPTSNRLPAFKAGLYGDFIQEVDHTFGRLVTCLEEKGVLDNTLIIFASDNGGERYAEGMPQCEAEAAGLSIKSIEDVTPLPHNGCRPPKRRRV